MQRFKTTYYHTGLVWWYPHEVYAGKGYKKTYRLSVFTVNFINTGKFQTKIYNHLN